MKNKMMDEDIENVGIMQGFMDSMADEGDDEGSDDEETIMERRPDSPEILMNNLRGDMRSLDARRDELADLVGYKAAKETPEQVLAMLQPVLAQQGGAGIGALPQSQPMAQGPQPPMMGAAPGAAPGGAPGAPPPGMPPMPPEGAAPPPPADGGIAALAAGMGGGAPGGMPPSDQPPVAMARGGYVQHFQTGSDESGVTPTGDQTATEGPLLAYPPELVAAAKANAAGLISQQPQAIPTLGAQVQKRLPEYQRLLGADRGMAEAQMLLELGQRAFGFAANTDEGGRPLRGSFVSRLAGATKTLPTAIGRHIESMDKIDRQIKALAVQQGEKDIDQVVSQNTELLKRKTDLFKEVLKADARLQAERIKGLGSSIFGKGDWEWNVVNMPGLMDRYALGQTDDTENKLINSAITKFKTPRFETHFHPVSKQPYTKEMPVMIPDFVTAAEASRRKLNLPVSATPALAPAGTSTVPATSGGEGERASPPPGATTAAPAGGGQPQVSLWKERFNISGPVSAAIGIVSGIPGVGDPAAHITLARQQAQQQAERVVESLMKSTAGNFKEQERLRPVIGIIPSATLDPDAYGTKLIALGATLQDMIREYDAQGRSKDLKPDDVGFALKRAMDLRRQYNMLGLPPAVYTRAELLKYPPGTEVLVNGTILQRVKERE